MSIQHVPPLSETNRTALELLTVNQVAQLLAVSRATVYRLERAGELRSVLVGERLRFRVRDVDAYLGRREPAA